VSGLYWNGMARNSVRPAEFIRISPPATGGIVPGRLISFLPFLRSSAPGK
jgi:hypothetical protein